MNSLFEKLFAYSVTVTGAEVLAQSEKYQPYAREAQEQADQASTDSDRAVRLLRSWLAVQRDFALQV